MENDEVTFFVVFLRSLRSLCPVCGRGRLFARVGRVQQFADLFLPLKNCNACGFEFARQPGYYFGVVTPVLPILAVFTGAVFAGVSYFGFNQQVDNVLIWGGVGIIIGIFLFFRSSIAVYIAIDHAIDPPKRADGKGEKSDQKFINLSN
jgi:uncharacterized protein (DUF983 family)